MNRHQARALPAALVTAAVLLASCGSDDPAESARPGTGTSSGASIAPQPDYRVVPDWDVGRAIPSGRWAVHANGGPAAPVAVLDVPEGFAGNGWAIWTNRGNIGYWTVAGVYDDPCSEAGQPRPVGATVADLADALEGQKLTASTKAVPVSVGGHDGLYLELTTPEDYDYGACREDSLTIFRTSPSESRSIGESWVDHYWILDVDGQRVVLSVGVPAVAPRETVQLLSGLVEGATFIDEA